MENKVYYSLAVLLFYYKQVNKGLIFFGCNLLLSFNKSQVFHLANQFMSCKLIN